MYARSVLASILWALLAATSPTWAGEPYRPTEDSTVVLRLPAAAVQARREFQASRATAADVTAAADAAQRHIERARELGDPRFLGYAQSALAPWWTQAGAPERLLVLRATVKQSLHQFDAALADLDLVLQRNPRQLQARLTRATLRQVTGRFAASEADCQHLHAAGDAIAIACLTAAARDGGTLRRRYEQLVAAIARTRPADPSLRGWLYTVLAETADRLGLREDAARWYRTGLAADRADAYSLAAYADHLLAAGRRDEAAALLKSRQDADALLLRYCLASRDDAVCRQLAARFAASRLRGDRLHQREEARFRLEVEGDAKTALALARNNWEQQHEPADLRLLVAAALAASDQQTLREARAWMAETGYQDAPTEALLAMWRTGGAV